MVEQVNLRHEARKLALSGERFDTTEDLAGALDIDPTDDPDAIGKMWRAALAYHDAGGRFSDEEETNFFNHHDW
jgi:hypothetical protein